MNYPIFPGSGGGTPRRRKTIVRRSRKLQRLVRRGASNQKITRVSNNLARSVNRQQAAGTFGGRKQVAVRRATRTLARDSSAYSKTEARQLRRAARPRRVVKRSNDVGPKGPHGHYQPPHIKRPRLEPEKDINKLKHTHLNRPGAGKPHHKGNGPGGHHQGPGRHHGAGPGKGKPRHNRPPKKPKYKPVKLGAPGKKLARRIENVTEKRYLYASDKRTNQLVAKFRKRRKYIVQHTKGKKKEQKKIKIARKNLMKDVRERGTGAKPLYRKAGLAVSAELDPQLKALTTRIKQEKRNKSRTLSGLKRLYSTAGRQNEEYSNRIKEQSQNEIDRTDAAFNNLVDRIGNTYDTSRAGVTDELARLGISGASSAATEGIDRDKQYATSLARTSGEEAGADLRIGKSDFNQLMGLLGGEIQAQGLGARTEARQKFADALMAYRDQRSALAATRLGKISTAAEAMRAARAAQKAEAAQNRLANIMARKQFGLDVAKFKQDVRQDRFGNKMDRLHYDLDKAKFLADQMKNNRKKKPAKPRSYSNSRAGAVDYLKDRGMPNAGIDTYLRLVQSGGEVGTVKGPFGIPIPIPNNLVQPSNRKIDVMMKALRSKGVNPSVVQALRTALQIEWGLI